MSTPGNELSAPGRGAVCQMCGQDMLASAGCTWEGILIRDVRYRRVKYGAETGWPVSDEAQRCPDCGALLGHYHHFGCDIERAPDGVSQLIMLDEDWAYTDTVGE